MISSPVFRDRYGKISVNHLILYAFLNCPDDVEKKSEILYSLFQEGGPGKFPDLSAMDKDVEPVISKLV